MVSLKSWVGYQRALLLFGNLTLSKSFAPTGVSFVWLDSPFYYPAFLLNNLAEQVLVFLKN
ncbi:hypothetical protein COD92_28600 [Bacillus sp. AFS037270]|nr:hypothetical protein COD92_28600 [Bacillus sp. AFS037270]